MGLILTLNLGSSSLKYGLFLNGECVERGEVDGIGSLLLPAEIDGIGHRLVLGGDSPLVVDDTVIEKIRKHIPLAPLHLPRELEIISEARRLYPLVPQVCCFDTAFHASLPEVAARFSLPKTKCPVRRLGFHGLSYESVCHRVGTKRAVVAHLGSGCSLAAIDHGRCIDTTMGLTPVGGVMMATRSGDLDPGLMFYLMRDQNMSLSEVEHLVNLESGWLGVSQLSSDMKTLIESDHPEAQLAVDMFCYSVKKAVGALSAALGGADQLIFTGGIGERCEEVRDKVSHGFDLEVFVVPADEEAMIAKHTAEVLCKV